jgi:hypothetical protein
MLIARLRQSGKTYLKKFFLLSLICVFFFLILEGLSSLLLFVSDLLLDSRRSIAERFHTQYDKDLGWANVPNVSLKDFYGPGIDFRTNSRGFRNNEEFDVQVPHNKVRLICSGDSFTLGYGVDNDHSWCQLLASLDPRFQTVNMGQAGYGMDQMYLWYQRDGRPLQHDIHLFAVIWVDFWRMQNKRAFGYSKPVLRVENGNLVVENVPVPRRSAFTIWLTQSRYVFKELRTIELLERILQKFSPQKPAVPLSSEQMLPAADREVLRKMFEDLQATNKQKNSIFILVYLPVDIDYKPHEPSSTYRQFLREEAERKGILFIDLVDDFQKLPRQEMEKLFIPPGTQYFLAAPGHYWVEGNEYVAKKLYSKLISASEVAKKLALTDRQRPGRNGTVPVSAARMSVAAPENVHR